MRIVEIAARPNGGHRNRTSSAITTVPDGWALVPDGLLTKNFPFGEPYIKELDGVPTVIAWTPLPVPEEEPEEDVPESGADIWAELDAAYREGVDSV